MRTPLLAHSLAFLAASGSAALAQATPAPDATAGGLADWWWVILLVIVAAVAIWYFTRGRTGTRI
jgi:hypothetical protein